MNHASSTSLLATTIILATLGCSANYLSVTVSAASSPPGLAQAIVQLSVTAYDAMTDGGPVLLPPDGPMQGGLAGLPDASLIFTVQAPSQSNVSVLVQGLDLNGAVVAANLGNSIITSKTNLLTLVLQPACGSDSDCDPDGFCSGHIHCGAEQFCEAPNTSNPTPPDAGTPCGPCPLGACGAASDGGPVCLLADCGCPTKVFADGGMDYQFDPSKGEQCNGADNSDTLPDHCRTNCRLPHCGDDVVDTASGEICDLGTYDGGMSGQNGTGVGCSITCNMTGSVITVAGRPNDAGLVDGNGGQAEFDQPYGITLLNGKLYVADAYSRAVRQVDPSSGQVITIAGGDSKCSDVDGLGTAGTFCDVNGILAYDAGLLVTDDSALRYLIPPSGTQPLWDVTTWAGQLATNGVPPTGVDGGPFADAIYGVPQGIAAIGQTVYTVSKLDGFVLASDPVTRLVSVLSVIGGGSGNTTIQLAGLVAVNGQLYVSIEISSGSVEAIDPTIPYVQGTPNYKPLISNTLNNPDGLCTDGYSLFICESGKNRIMQYVLDAGYGTGALGILAGKVANSVESDGLFDAGFDSPRACVFDTSTRTLYVTDKFGDTVRAVQ